MRHLLLSLACLALPLCADAQTWTTERRAYGLLLIDGDFYNEGFTSFTTDIDPWRCGARRGSRYAGAQRAPVTLREWSLVLGFPVIPLAAIPEASADAAALADHIGRIDPAFPGTSYLVDGADRSYYIHHTLDDVVAVMVDDLPPASALAEDCTGPGAEEAGLATPTGSGGSPTAGGDSGADPNPAATGEAPGGGRADRPPASEGAAGTPAGGGGQGASAAAVAVDLRDALVCRGAVPAPPPPSPVLTDAALDWLAFQARCVAPERRRKEIEAHLCAIGYPCAGPWDSPAAARAFLGKTWAEALWWLTQDANG